MNKLLRLVDRSLLHSFNLSIREYVPPINIKQAPTGGHSAHFQFGDNVSNNAINSHVCAILCTLWKC